ncbi:hypothetical protein [Vogesella oryzae]|uniref:hypothetical protein n=1 Tax=Vogesella oryzae TaxID=1735285 RepID=UPI001583BF24|nr:hypothetical protein [Vogesella oryzae]
MKVVSWVTGLLVACLLAWAAWPASNSNLFPPDTDGDLIRDDVGQLIAERFAANPAANASLRQLARAWQQGVQQSETTWPQAQQQIRLATSCVLNDAVLGKAHMSAETMYHFMQHMHAAIFDTPARRARWERFDLATNSAPFEDLPLNPCVFDPAALAG